MLQKYPATYGMVKYINLVAIEKLKILAYANNPTPTARPNFE